MLVKDPKASKTHWSNYNTKRCYSGIGYQAPAAILAAQTDYPREDGRLQYSPQLTLEVVLF